jgi:hypothetical protein
MKSGRFVMYLLNLVFRSGPVILICYWFGRFLESAVARVSEGGVLPVDFVGANIQCTTFRSFSYVWCTFVVAESGHQMGT